MSRDESFKDRRKYQRVLVEPSSKVLSVDVVGFGKTLIFDMSYNGAAFAQPKERKIENPDEDITLHLRTEVDEARVKAQIIRINPEVVAVNFGDISVEARVIIDRVVSDRIVGLNMSYISPRHYSTNTDFNHWFHGPKETNLYFWCHEDRLDKVQMELDSALLIYEDDSFICENKAMNSKEIPKLNNQQIVLKAVAIVEQIENDLPPLTEFKKILKEHVQA